MSSQQHLLILDLNGLLLHRQYQSVADEQQKTSNHRRACADAIINNFAVYIRPDAIEFLKWCHEHFVVALWSTCRRQNMQPLIDLLYTDIPRHEPDMILSQEDCFNTGIMHPMFPSKPILVKLLTSVWQKFKSKDSNKHGHFAAHNTLLLDDAPYKAIGNERFTSIHPNAWHPLVCLDSVPTLASGGILQRLLSSIVMSKDVRPLVKDFERSAQNSRSPRFKICEKDPTFAYLASRWDSPIMYRRLTMLQDAEKGPSIEEEDRLPQLKRTRLL